MDCFLLDLVSWQLSQSFYHAAAHLGREALFILRPATPYVCLGFHQDAQQEIDLAFTTRVGIPVFRREVGGGAVYLDSGQLFYQLILKADRPGLPADKLLFYRQYLHPVIETFRAFGLSVEFRPVNDILVNDRKISGNGAAEIEGMLVLVGNFIIDFNYELMSKCLRVPDEKFRDKVYKTLQDNLTTMRREIADLPTTVDLAQELIFRYERLLGPLDIKTAVDLQLNEKADQLLTMMNTPQWLYANDHRRPAVTEIKIRDGVFVLHKVFKLTGGLVRFDALSLNGVLQDVHISGDFFIYPQRAIRDLEIALEGTPLVEEDIGQVIQDFYQESSLESPGIAPLALAQAIAAAAPNG